MKAYKYISSGGLAFDESGDMEKLSEYAKDGWLLHGSIPFGYELKKSKPQNIVYSVDFEDEPDDDYFQIFKEAGWALVFSTAGTHYFSAPEETLPIYTDKTSIVDKNISERDNMAKIFKKALLPFIITMVIAILVAAFSLPKFVSLISIIIHLFFMTLLVFSGSCYLAYRKTVKHLLE